MEEAELITRPAFPENQREVIDLIQPATSEVAVEVGGSEPGNRHRTVG